MPAFARGRGATAWQWRAIRSSGAKRTSEVGPCFAKATQGILRAPRWRWRAIRSSVSINPCFDRSLNHTLAMLSSEGFAEVAIV